MSGRRWAPAIDRFMEKVTPITESGCWIWLGCTIKAGYGRFNWDNRDSYAHIFSFEFHGGEIPEGCELDHKCRVRCCVNPDHLEAVIPRINKLRGISPPALNAQKTECPQGHPYDSTNTYVKPSGYRECRICVRAANRAASKRRTERKRRTHEVYKNKIEFQPEPTNSTAREDTPRAQSAEAAAGWVNSGVSDGDYFLCGATRG